MKMAVMPDVKDESGDGFGMERVKGRTENPKASQKSRRPAGLMALPVGQSRLRCRVGERLLPSLQANEIGMGPVKDLGGLNSMRASPRREKLCLTVQPSLPAIGQFGLSSGNGIEG